MRSPIGTFATLILGAVLLSPDAAHAYDALESGDYSIHYNALSTELLPPQVAKVYGIERSRNRGIVNVAVRKGEGVGRAVEAKISATATNLNGQLQQIDMRELTDRDAIYYIGEFSISGHETFDFVLEITPEGSRTRTIEFRREFFGS